VTALRILLARLIALFGGDTRRERDLRAEIDAHIAEAAEEYVRQGMTPEEARYAALRQFGGRHPNRRSPSRPTPLHVLLHVATGPSVRRADAVRAPGFAIVAVLTLAAAGVLALTLSGD
jgi:hypothetical protein